GRAALRLRKLAQRVSQRAVALDVLARHARMPAPEVVLAELVRRRETSGEEAPAERAVCDEADSQLAHGVEHLPLRIARPQRPFRLQGGDRMHRVRTADRRRARLGQPDVLHLPGPDELRQRADRLLDWRVRVDAVLVVQIDVVDSEPPQRRVDGLVDVPGRAVDPAAPVLEPTVSELGGDHTLVAAAGDRLADELLVRALAVDVGRVEEIEPEAG